jgi:hypothetical protein
MISRKLKLLAAAASLVAVATTVGLAGTRHTRTTAAQQFHDSGGKVTPFGQNGFPHHGILTCGPSATTTACEAIEMMLPMSATKWTKPFKLPIKI